MGAAQGRVCSWGGPEPIKIQLPVEEEESSEEEEEEEKFDFKEKYEQIFKAYDTDKNGTLDRDEFKRFWMEMLIAVGADSAEFKDIGILFDIVDADNNGKVTFEELWENEVTHGTLVPPTDHESYPEVKNFLQEWKPLPPALQHTHSREKPSFEIPQTKVKPEEKSQKKGSSRVDMKDFKKLRPIGKGGFGEVWVIKKRDTGEVFAMKMLDKKQMMKKKATESVEIERDLMNKSRSPWIVHLHYTFQDNQFLYMVMEFLAGGDLMGLLQAKDTFSERESRFFVAEILLAIRSVHKLGYIHRDIKPDNILLDRHGHVKLSDFGLAHRASSKGHAKKRSSLKGMDPKELANMNKKDLYKKASGSLERRERAYSLVGSPDYIAPEILDLGPKGYDKAADFWSLGVVLFECLYGYPPFWDEDPLETERMIKHIDYEIPASPPVSSAAKDLIRRLLSPAKKRPGFDEIRKHPFFKRVDFNRIRQGKSPFVPKLTAPHDTRYFGPVKVRRKPDEPSEDVADGQFAGFTYNEEAMKKMKKKKKKKRSDVAV